MWQIIKSNAGKAAVVGLTVASLSSVSAAANATSIDDLPISEELKQLIRLALTAPATSPGIAQSSPVGFGANWGSVFAGIGGAQTTDQVRNSANGKSVEGSASVGFGLGDSIDLIGLETTINIISLTGSGRDDSELGEDGNVNFKLHKMLGNTTSIAIGIENAVSWGSADDEDNSKYFSLSHVTTIRPSNPMSLVVTAGFGDSRFKDQTEASLTRDNDNGINPFAAVSLAFTRRASVIADWSGSSLGVAVSYVPFRQIPLSANLGLVDVSDRLDGGVRFTGGIGYSYNF